jgi:hypothetical protein
LFNQFATNLIPHLVFGLRLVSIKKIEEEELIFKALNVAIISEDFVAWETTHVQNQKENQKESEYEKHYAQESYIIFLDQLLCFIRKNESEETMLTNDHIKEVKKNFFTCVKFFFAAFGQNFYEVGYQFKNDWNSSNIFESYDAAL